MSEEDREQFCLAVLSGMQTIIATQQQQAEALDKLADAVEVMDGSVHIRTSGRG